MLDQASARHAGPEFTVVGLCIQGFEKRLLGCDQRPFQFQKLGFEEDGINAACVECNGVRCCFQSVSIMALFLSEQSGFEGPCLSALTVERQALLVGLKRQFLLALRFKVERTEANRPNDSDLPRALGGWLQWLPCALHGREGPPTASDPRRYQPPALQVGEQLAQRPGRPCSPGDGRGSAKQFWIVGGEFHPCLEPVAVKSVVAPEVERCVPTPRARFE